MRVIALACFAVMVFGVAASGQSVELASAVQPQTAEPAWQPSALERSALPTARALDYEFDDVQISTILGWLRRFRVEPPVALDGRVSGWVWAQAPARGWWRLGDYRVEGEFKSPLLDIDRYSIRTAQVRFGYHQGLWTVGRATGQFESRDAIGVDDAAPDNVPSGRRVLGQADLAGRLPMSTSGPVHLQGTMRHVPLFDLLTTLGLTANVPSGTANGDFSIDTTISQLSQPLSWNARGRVSAQSVAVGDSPSADLQTIWQLASARLSLTDTRVTIAGRTIVLAANLQLTDAFQWDVQLPSQSVLLAPDLYATLRAPVTDALPLGTVQLSAASSGQLAPWGAQYALQLASPRLNWFQNSLVDFSADLGLTQAGIRINNLSTQVAGGRLSGEGVWPAGAAAPVTVKLNYQQLDLSQFRAPIELPAMVGIVSGSGEARFDSTKLEDLKSIAFDVQGAGEGVRINEWGFGNIAYTLQKDSGNESISIALRDNGATARWGATGTVQPIAADEGWSYDIDADANRLDLSFAQLARLLNFGDNPPELIDIVLATGKLGFRGNSIDGIAATSFDLTNVTALERDGSTWATGVLAGRTSPSVVEITRGDFDVGDGKVHLETTWNFNGDGTDRLQLVLQEFSLASVRNWNVVTIPVDIAGRVSANIDVERAAANASVLAGWLGSLDVSIDDLAVRGQAVGSVRGSGQLEADNWQTEISGEVFEAPLAGQLNVTIDQEPAWSLTAVRGSLTWLGGEAHRLLAVWQEPKEAAQWRGEANLRAEIDWQSEGPQSGFVRIEIPDLAYRGRGVAREVALDAALDANVIRIVRFSGGVGGGRVDVSGEYDLRSQRASGLVIDLQRIDLERAVQLLDPKLSTEVAGRADLRARVSLVNGLTVSGHVRLRDGLLYRVPVSEAHSDFDLVSSPGNSVMRVHARNIRGRAFGGRLDGDLSANIGTRLAFESRVLVERGEVEQLSDWAGTTAVVGTGKFNAALTIGASHLESSRDLRGRLELSFEDTDARSLPVSGQLARFVPLFGLPATEFERGKLVAFISRGDLRMRSLALWGSQLSVLGSGNIGLVSGRLDLQLVVRVGGGLSQQIASSYLSQLAATAVPPVELVLQINRLVANRAIFLRVAGTAAKPVIQPQTGRMIEQALLRSLLEQAAPVASALTTASAQ